MKVSIMKKIYKILFTFFLVMGISSNAISSEDFFKKGLELFKEKKLDDAKFMFERSIVFNPKDSNSYLYLAKIYNHQEDQDKEEKNLDATLLIEPKNEEAILMLMKIGLKRSNYSKVKDLSKTFTEVCKKLCNENKEILETLANIEPKNES
jgi:tetratricopeptide (TPR) repeat protein|tara:strand:- start:439 stop:891 length:453 start_codon:yes stop_codon:yes gene_type:complete